MIVSGKDTFGVFIDYPGKVTFDCGYTDLDTLRITVAEENYDLYIIEGHRCRSQNRRGMQYHHPPDEGIYQVDFFTDTKKLEKEKKLQQAMYQFDRRRREYVERWEDAALADREYPAQECAPPVFAAAPPPPATPMAARSLENLMDNLGESFTTRLLRLIDERGLKDSTVYKQSNISRQHFSKIQCNRDYNRSCGTVWNTKSITSIRSIRYCLNTIRNSWVRDLSPAR